MKWIAKQIVLLFQSALSPLLPRVCRFEPTCSNYALHALQHHGFLRAAWLIITRLLRCHPLCRGGYDPVPPRGEPPSAH